jgi:hypothetical protein
MARRRGPELWITRPHMADYVKAAWQQSSISLTQGFSGRIHLVLGNLSRGAFSFHSARSSEVKDDTSESPSEQPGAISK